MSGYERYLNKVVDTIFDEASGLYTWTQLADAAGLCYSTIYKLGKRQTRLPQLRTIYLLANAVGMDVSLIKRTARRLRKVA